MLTSHHRKNCIGHTAMVCGSDHRNLDCISSIQSPALYEPVHISIGDSINGSVRSVSHDFWDAGEGIFTLHPQRLCSTETYLPA